MSLEIWLCDLCYTQQGVSAEVMPAAVGGIATFCETQIKHELRIRLFKYPERLIEALAGGPPQIVGFSNYCWNSVLSYGFAEVMKHKHPEMTVVMGGPNYPLDPESQRRFIEKHPMIDFYVFREGELPFAKLVEALIDYDFKIDKVKALRLDDIHTILEHRRFLAGDQAGRLCDLSLIPSPYLTGKMDEFFDGKLMPILQTNRGCPFKCAYCNEGNSCFNKVYFSSKLKIRDEIDYMGRHIARSREAGGRNDLFIADDNFGMFMQDADTCRSLTRAKEVYGWPEYITVATGKKHMKRVLNCARIMNGAMRLTGSVQSLDPEVLKNINRSNVTTQQLLEFADEANKIAANSQAEVILGLPGDSVDKHFKSIGGLIDAGFVEVRMYQLMMLVGTKISEVETRERFRIGTQYRVIPRSFGNYRVDDETRVIGAEIEEVATSLNSLTFQDYLCCRRFDLIINLFYNDGIFQGLLTLLRHLGISRYEWIRTISEYQLPAGLAKEIENFIHETKNELWDSIEELSSYTKRPEIIAQFINGEFGSNVILKYKGLIVNNYLHEMAEIARTAAVDVIVRKGKLTTQIEAIMEDLLTFDELRKVDIWKGDYKPHYATLKFDIVKFLKRQDGGAISDFVLDQPQEFVFSLNEEQIGIIERSLNAYGRDQAGMSRIYTRVHMMALNRQVSPHAT